MKRNEKDKRLATNLRKNGLSYSDIQKKLSISKSTLSSWCKDVPQTRSQKQKNTLKRLRGAEKGRAVAAQMKKDDKKKTIRKIMKTSIKDVGKLNEKEFFIAGTALYLGDGLKGDKEVGFSNSNPKVIAFMMKWLRVYCKITDSDFRGQIWIHDNLDERKAKIFWSKLTKIPSNQFRKSYISKNKTNSRKVRKNIHENGIFSIKVSRVNTQRKIVGWMAGIIKGVSV